jgi:1,4-alpha-glucan branching enzyme
LDKVKGVLLLLDTYAQLVTDFPDVRLYICGGGRHRHLIESKINELKLRDKVILTGKVGWGELREYYHRAYIFVYPSFLDCSPQTVKEAQACGAPAVVTDSSGAAELVVDGRTGIVCRPTVESLVDSISYLLKNPEIRHSMSVQAAEHIQHNLSWEATAAKFNEVIASLSHLENARGKN